METQQKVKGKSVKRFDYAVIDRGWKEGTGEIELYIDRSEFTISFKELNKLLELLRKAYEDIEY